jgi:hypothetical protein
MQDKEKKNVRAAENRLKKKVYPGFQRGGQPDHPPSAPTLNKKTYAAARSNHRGFLSLEGEKQLPTTCLTLTLFSRPLTA